MFSRNACLGLLFRKIEYCQSGCILAYISTTTLARYFKFEKNEQQFEDCSWRWSVALTRSVQCGWLVMEGHVCCSVYVIGSKKRVIFTQNTKFDVITTQGYQELYDWFIGTPVLLLKKSITRKCNYLWSS